MTNQTADTRSATTHDLYAGRLFKILRKKRNISQPDLAKMAGISFQQLQKYEAGKNRISIGRMILLCNALDIKSAHFISKVETNSTKKSPKDKT